MAKVSVKLSLKGGDDPRYPNVTGVTVPPKVVQALGGLGRIPISGTINGFPFRTTIVVMGGRHMFCGNKRRRAGGGDPKKGPRVAFVRKNDEAPRPEKVPADLAKALRPVSVREGF